MISSIERGYNTPEIAYNDLESAQEVAKIPQVNLTKRLEPGRPEILSSRVIPFSEHTDFFREIFQSSPDEIFSVYNPSAAFINPPNLYRAVRVDCTDGTTKSFRTKSVIFKDTEEGLKPHPERTFDLEDPFASNIDGEIVFGGVQVNKSFDSEGMVVSSWRTILYRGKTIHELKPFFTGPEGMKDIRLVKRPDSKIGVYTRPRRLGDESLGGDGQIGYREFESLDELENSDSSCLDINNAPLLSSFRFPDGQWGGVNQAQVKEGGKYDGWNVLLTHRAYKDTTRHYRSEGLLHDPKTDRIVDLGTFIETSDLPPGPWKGQEEGDEDLKDVHFGSELIIGKDRLIISGGVGDARCEVTEITIHPELAA